MKKAIFLGWQEDGHGGAFPLFDVITDDKVYPHGSTVGVLTLKTFDITVPEYPPYSKEER